MRLLCNWNKSNVLIPLLQALSVFLLYVRCSAINPADPGVLGNQSLSKNDEKSSFSQISATLTAELDDPSSPAVPSALSAVHSDKDLDQKFTYTEQGRIGWNKPPSICSFAGLCGLCCGWLVTDDHCINDAKFEQPVPEEDILFCTLCNAEVTSPNKRCTVVLKNIDLIVQILHQLHAHLQCIMKSAVYILAVLL